MATTPKASSDQFSNKFYGSVATSAADTLTYEEIPTQVDTFSKEAWIINRLEWFFPVADLSAMDASGDLIRAALCSSNQPDDLNLSQATLIDMMELGFASATAVGFTYYAQPYTRDFSKMPGGGIIIAPRPLYIALDSVALGVVVHAEVRGSFQRVSLTPDQYLDLIDFYRIVS